MLYNMTSSVIYFGLALFILTCFVVQIDSYLKPYISLVFDIHEYYGTSSVFFVLPSKKWNFKDYTSTYFLSRKFSEKYDFTSIINLNQLENHRKLYQKRIPRSLLVIYLRSLSDIADLTENIKFIRKSYIYLVIFIDETRKSELCEYCKSPIGNSLQLKFDTEMLVLCCDSFILKEWWSINGNNTKVADFASLTNDKKGKLMFHVHPVALNSRRNDLTGTGIRIGLVGTCPYAYTIDNEIRGLLGDILSELKRSMNFTITEIVQSPEYGDWDSNKKKWTGIIGRVVEGDADLGVADFTMTKSRLNVLEYTQSLMVYKHKLYIRDQLDTGVNWTAYFKVFSVNIWISTIVIIILVPILLTVIKVFRSSRKLLSPIVESYLNVWGIFCQQGLCEFPGETSLRIAYLSIFILALIIYAAYSAALVSFITISRSGLPFTTLEGFVNDGSYGLIVPKDTAEYEFFANSTDQVLKKMMKLMKPAEKLPKSVWSGWDQVCQEKVALFTNNDISNTKCKVTAIDSGYVNIMAIIMPAGSQYSKAIKYHIQRFKDTGVMERINHKYYDSIYKSFDDVETTFDDFKLMDVAPVLATLTIGIILALLVLLAEAMYNALQIYLRNRGHRKNFRGFQKSMHFHQSTIYCRPPNIKCDIPLNNYK